MDRASDHVGAHLQNPHNPEIVVIDPRNGNGDGGQLSIFPSPRKRVILNVFYGIARRAHSRGWIDEEYIRAHTEDFDNFKTPRRRV